MNQKSFGFIKWSLIGLGAFVLLAIPSISEAAGEIIDVAGAKKEFIEFNTYSVVFLIVLGFLGGLLSGFIGSGGAFVLTPGMMSLGVPAAIAVATNMCHKFPKAMIGAYKRYKYGQVDIKLGLIMAVSATIGVQIGIKIQKIIINTWGSAGSNLYVSVVFVVVLVVVGLYVFSDARKSMRSNNGEESSALAEAVKKIKIPPMIKINAANREVSIWVTIPVGLATGLLAATIAVGGFIGVPGMIYVLGVPAIVATATELVIAFVMGLSGSFTWALGGFVDIRMVVLIMAGSLIGVQLGAMGTTYVKDYMIKLVMATVMLIVAVSRGFAIPGYLNSLGALELDKSNIALLDKISFALLGLALIIGGVIILFSMWKGKRELRLEAEKEKGHDMQPV